MEDLRLIIRMKKIPMSKIAQTIGIAESTLYIWMRKYDEEHHNKIAEAIQKIERGEDHDENH